MRPGSLSFATLLLFTVMLGLAGDTPVAQSANAVAPAGEVMVEPATLISAGFEWRIDGDANRNAVVAVAYRKKGRATGAGACRCCASAASERCSRARSITRRRTCSPAASST